MIVVFITKSYFVLIGETYVTLGSRRWRRYVGEREMLGVAAQERRVTSLADCSGEWPTVVASSATIDIAVHFMDL